MRGAAIADTHLGFRQFPALIDGRNWREVDTEIAWFTAIDQIIEAKPDLVTIAGDCFHHPRVSDFAKKAFIEGIWKLRQAGIVVIILMGNHDAGRTSDVLTPIVLPDHMDGVHIVTTPKWIKFHIGEPDGTKWVDEPATPLVSVACFPFVVRGDGENYRLDPDPDADVNVLCMHAAVKGSTDGDSLPYFYGGGDQALDVGREAERWDVIAVGDYHEFTRLHPTRPAFYSGSLERTSSNIWQETAPKGWVLWDSADGTAELQEVPTRPMLDFLLEDLHGAAVEPNAEAVNEALRCLAEMPEIADAIVRLKVPEFPREDRHEVDWSLVRAVKHEALHCELDLRYAAREFTDLGDRREQGERGEARTLAEDFADFFADDDPEVRECALEFLDLEAEVEDVEEAEELEEVAVA